MAYHPDAHRRRSIRRKGYDYVNAGAYFVTICTHERECLFGEVVEEEMRLNGFGTIVQKEWLLTAELRDYVTTDVFVVMPNHFHTVLVFDDVCRGTARRAPTVESFGHPIAGSLATVMRSFKSAVTKRINLLRETPGVPVWQRNFYERVIRDDRELATIREYIANNPAKWDADNNNPLNCGRVPNPPGM